MKRVTLITTVLLLAISSSYAQQNYYATQQTIYIDSSISLNISPQSGYILITNANDQNDEYYYMPKIEDREMRKKRHYISEGNRKAARDQMSIELAALFCKTFPEELAYEFYNQDRPAPLNVDVYFDRRGVIHCAKLHFLTPCTQLQNVPPICYANFLKGVKKIKMPVEDKENEFNYGYYTLKIEADQLPK